MKKRHGFESMIVLMLLICLGGCYSKENTPPLTNQPSASPSVGVTRSFTPIPTSRTQTPTVQASVQTSTVTNSISLPVETLSPTETETRLLNLLKSNGNCTGKCIAGIYPDHMTLQEAVNQLAQWGTVIIYQNPKQGTFYRLDQQSLDGRVWVQFGVGAWTKERANVNNMEISITGTADSFIDSESWQANQTTWHAFQLEQILAAYGVPSDVRFDFSNDVKGKWVTEGRTISYSMYISYKQLNIDIDLTGLAHDDGQKVFLCPSKDPHYLNIKFNSDVSEEKLSNAYPVIWQKLMNTDLPSFYQVFTNTSASDCITPTLSQILSLEPDFLKVVPPN